MHVLLCHTNFKLNRRCILRAPRFEKLFKIYIHHLSLKQSDEIVKSLLPIVFEM